MTQMTPVLVRMPDELLAKIDAQRGDVPRAVFIRRACERAVTTHVIDAKIGADGQATFSGGPINVLPGESVAVRVASELPEADSALSGVRLGPVRPKPGAMLKNR